MTDNDKGSIPDYARADWLEYRRYVLLELERTGKVIAAISEKVDRVRIEDLSSIKTDIVLLKFQAALWGSMGGIVFSAVVTALMKFLVH